MTQSEKINTIFLLADIIDQYANEIKSGVKQEFKMEINRLTNQSRKIIKFADGVLSEENQELFGDSADKIRELIERDINV